MSHRLGEGLTEFELLPPEISEIVDRYRQRGAKALRDEDVRILQEYFTDKDMRVTLREAGYPSRVYTALHRLLHRRIGGVRPTTLEDLQKWDFGEFVRTMWEEAKSIGQDTVMRWVTRASEMGYYDEEAKRVQMNEFVKDAIEYFLSKAPEEREREHELAFLRVLSEVLILAHIRFIQFVDTLALLFGIAQQMNPQLRPALIPLKALVDTIREEHA